MRLIKCQALFCFVFIINPNNHPRKWIPLCNLTNKKKKLKLGISRIQTQIIVKISNIQEHSNKLCADSKIPNISAGRAI